MELKHLNTFLTLSKIKNFTRTAEHLNYAQSNITAHIQQLEKELDVHLFERIGKSVELTREGEKLVPYAEKMLLLSSDIKKMYKEKDNYGRIVIGASESICIFKLPEIIKVYKEKYPDVDLFIKTLDSSDFVPLLADNTIDIAFILDLPINDKSTISVLKNEEPICILSVPETKLALKEKVYIQDFKNVPFILTVKSCCYRSLFEKELSESSIVPKIVLETGSIQVIKQTVLSGLGLCLLPELAVEKELKKHELVKIPYTTDYNIFSQLIYHKDKWLSKNFCDFISIVKKTYGIIF
ncbi:MULTISPECIES: LysR family transcriptional regulator [unclassified Clostridioides]|uniref:LysR family transcriptional regulator n=1 Tax=unclassified Clostridioides TaxID=2635829 RepID=UPI001D115952|nr:LysR family transcriptional regulator [Clostridioides sp. ES-S-0049-03]MCC0676737.1 LysR family transcriptional regulator [Clostridioides sp. ES-W-0018-02]MCC0703179.1 LysR family transcriptional regulator [Clostridioides sp. ES-S-0049-02]MCC0711880.1 LysR family transcriptional regulator [Clostridioides sp. ES-W-0017-02]UDN57492.1 LysR family transcriptional regulator [Clostridioides sp. ES-S-0010-02]UDN62915.1 LysR family transcriptional regulator [Clostridioides sp. ES-W-0016-02]